MTPDDRKALRQKVMLRVAAGDALSRVAADLGVPLRTARRWSAKPGFRKAVEAARRRAVDRAIGRLSRAAVRAAETMERLARRGTKDDATRLAAAQALLGHLLEVRGAVEMEERLAALEERMAREATHR